MAYAYDRAGNLTRQRYPSERVVDYVYDGAGRIAGAKTGADGWYAGGTGTNAVDYEPHGGVKQLLLGNGLWEQRRYNVRLQPTRIGLGTTKTTGSLTPTGSGLLLLDYSYGASSNNGNVLSQRIRVGTSLNQNQVYTYDALNRLKTAGETGSGTAWSQTYTYDRYGNRRVTAGASHGSNQALTPQSTADIAAGTNRLAGLKGVNAVTYDAAGNLKADWAANAFKYDGDNRLGGLRRPLGPPTATPPTPMTERGEGSARWSADRAASPPPMSITSEASCWRSSGGRPRPSPAPATSPPTPWAAPGS